METDPQTRERAGSRDVAAAAEERREAAESAVGARVGRLRDRWLHPLHRRLALRRLARRGGISSVLFVCVGNIYRSPFAEAVFRSALAPPFRKTIDCRSAGLAGADWGVPPEGVAAAAERGMDLSSHRSRLLTAAVIRGVELVVVMDASLRGLMLRRYGRSSADVLILGDLDPEPVETRGIVDPYGRDAGVLAASFARIERCTGVLARAAMGIDARP